MDYAAESLRKHHEWRGKLDVRAKVPVNNRDDLSLAYTPGVAEPCLAIQADAAKSFAFRGTLDVRAADINDDMKIAAARAIAGLIAESELSPDYIIPAAFDRRVRDTVASAVMRAARDSGVARV